MTVKEAIIEFENSIKGLRSLITTENEEERDKVLNRLEATEIALEIMRREVKK